MPNFPRLRVAHVMLLLATIGPTSEAATHSQLAEYLGPKDGQTYVYTLSDGQNSILREVTVAGVAKSKVELLTCSPASVADYPKELRKRGARPIVATVTVRDNAILTTHGRRTATLLKLPLTANAAHWINHQTTGLPNGARRETTLWCGISSVGKRRVLGSVRTTVTVTCATGDHSIITTTTYGKGLGPVEEDIEAFQEGKSVGVLKRQLTAIRSSTGECAALAGALTASKPPPG